jgi:hypothetical protein
MVADANRCAIAGQFASAPEKYLMNAGKQENPNGLERDSCVSAFLRDLSTELDA